jgi:plasmid stabilization system protein ParE
MIVYELKYLPSAITDILEIDVYLYERSPAAADKFADEIEQLTETLAIYPFMYPIYEDDVYFRHMTLPYKYRLFYHVDEKTKTIEIHRILHGMRDVKTIMDVEAD